MCACCLVWSSELVSRVNPRCAVEGSGECNARTLDVRIGCVCLRALSPTSWAACTRRVSSQLQATLPASPAPESQHLLHCNTHRLHRLSGGVYEAPSTEPPCLSPLVWPVKKTPTRRCEACVRGRRWRWRGGHRCVCILSCVRRLHVWRRAAHRARGRGRRCRAGWAAGAGYARHVQHSGGAVRCWCRYV